MDYQGDPSCARLAQRTTEEFMPCDDDERQALNELHAQDSDEESDGDSEG